MSRILLVGSHLGFNLEYYVKMALEKLGHSVTFFGYRNMLGTPAPLVQRVITRSAIVRTLAKPLLLNKSNEKLKEEAFKAEPNLMLSIKGEAVLPSTIEWIGKELGIKTALWYPDDPLFFKSFTKYVAPHYDHVFTASEKAVQQYREIGVKNVEFLPFACEPSIHKKINLSQEEEKRYGSDVCFVGTYDRRRRRIINKLNEFNVSIYGPYWRYFTRKERVHEVWGPDMVKVFNASKIVLDIYKREILQYEVSMRTFEATGSGSFLLTEKAYGLEKLFTVGKEIVCFKDEKKLLELIKYYLEADEERIEISARGHEKAYNEHTYAKRMENLLDKVK